MRQLVARLLMVVLQQLLDLAAVAVAAVQEQPAQLQEPVEMELMAVAVVAVVHHLALLIRQQLEQLVVQEQ
jgi:hypothetical protein